MSALAQQFSFTIKGTKPEQTSFRESILYLEATTPWYKLSKRKRKICYWGFTIAGGGGDSHFGFKPRQLKPMESKFTTKMVNT